MKANDLISRKDAIEGIQKLWKDAPSAQHLSAMFDCEDVIKNLPSMQPKYKRGEWIDRGVAGWICSSCSYRVFRYNNTPFCPNCGSDNREE